MTSISRRDSNAPHPPSGNGNGALTLAFAAAVVTLSVIALVAVLVALGFTHEQVVDLVGKVLRLLG